MKIIEAINSMISNPDKITNVIQNNGEYYFLYNDKYKWSIKTDDQGYVLFIYPKDDIDLGTLAYGIDYSEYNDYTVFKSEEIKTREATESFGELYQIVSAKLLGVDDILDDIINSDN